MHLISDKTWFVQKNQCGSYSEKVVERNRRAECKKKCGLECVNIAVPIKTRGKMQQDGPTPAQFPKPKF